MYLPFFRLTTKVANCTWTPDTYCWCDENFAYKFDETTGMVGYSEVNSLLILIDGGLV